MKGSTQIPTPRARVATPEPLERHRAVISTALRAAVQRLSPSVRQAVSYHLGWQDADGKETKGDGGKAIRPAIVLLAAEGVGAEPEAGVPGAVALELVHNFSLIHDDVMDGDEQRRHRPTVWALFGVGQAIVAGDAMLTLAHELLLEGACPRRLAAAAELSRATAEMIRGQCDDLSFEDRTDMTIDDGLTMSVRKTGALLGCAAALGGQLAGAEEDQVAALRGYGRELGIAFQAIDDVLGIWGDPAVTGKPAANDLRRGKKSLPVLHALRLSTPTAERELTALLLSGELANGKLDEAMCLLEDAGSRGWTLRLADRHLDHALTHLERAQLGPSSADDLLQVARFVTQRDF
jgi:geranylgeranyl diphosphate synthase, type I